MVGRVSHLRKLLRGELGGASIKNFWVPDILESLAPAAADAPAGSAANTFEISSLFAGDNVHFTAQGYARLAVSIVERAGLALKKQMESECVITGAVKSY